LKDPSIIPGIKELDRINQYALEALTQEERQFVEKMNKVVEDYENGSGVIFDFNEQIKIQVLWQKYEHLKPFQFTFNPEEKIPEVFRNKTAFIIWTAWKARHRVCNEDLIDIGSIAASRVLLESKPPFSKEIKERAINEFLRHLHQGYPQEGEMDFWENQIFPYLEGKWKFNWEMVQKCFYCSKIAIAICDSCSPTSSTGLTPERPFCEDCIASILGINIVKWLVPRHEGENEIEYALRKLKSKKIKA